MSGSAGPRLLVYPAAYCLSAVAAPLPFAAWVLVDSATTNPLLGVLVALEVMMVGIVMVGIYGLPAGLVGSVLVHVALRRVSSQTAHVAAFAAVGALTGWIYDVVLFDHEFGWVLPLVLGAATAAGRLAVVPMARRGR